jgi:rod shape determining protein RodA
MFNKKLLSHFDWALLTFCLALVGIGVLAVYSATYEEDRPLSLWTIRQTLWVGLGLIGMFVAFAVDYRHLKRWVPLLYVLVIILLLLMPVIGSLGGGARRWIRFGFISLQPSEFMKVTLVVMLARYLAREAPVQGYELRQMVIPALLVALPATLILIEPSLGTTGILGLIFLSVVFVAGLRLRSLAFAGLAGAAILPALWYGLKSYQKQRILSFLNPDLDPLGAGYHIIQSKITVGSGMIWGKGFLQGTQNRLDFLPEKHTDFVFAVLAEEWGLIGVALLLALYGVLLIRLLYVAWKARDRFGTLLVVGIAAMVFWQVVINVGMNTGVLPVVGVPLPFLSYGGSALLTAMVGIGLAINVSTRRFLF